MQAPQFNDTDDLFPDDEVPTVATDPVMARYTCRSCGLWVVETAAASNVLLCPGCRSDPDTTRYLAAARLEHATEAFEVMAQRESPEDQERYSRVQQERINAVSNPGHLARVNAGVLTARQRNDGLGRILKAEAELWVVSDAVIKIYDELDTLRGDL